MANKLLDFSKRHFSLIFYGLVLLFLVSYFNSIDFSNIDFASLSVGYLFLASIVALAFRYWGVYIWQTLLKDLGESSRVPRFSILAAIYSKAWLGRYVPGSVTWIAGKVYLASQVGIPKSRLTVASLLEGSMQIIAIAAVSLVLISFDSRFDVVPVELRFLLISAGGLLIVAIKPSIFNWVIARAYRIFFSRTPPKDLKTNNKAAVRSFALYSLGAFITGTSYFLLTKSIEPTTSWSLYLYLVGAYNLAGVAGMLTPLLPSGIGVRDGVQFLLLSLVFPSDVALALTVISRLWSFLIDIIFFLIAQLVYKIKSN